MLAMFTESLKGTSGDCQGTPRVTLLLVVSNFTSECTVSLFLDTGTLPMIFGTDWHGHSHLGVVSQTEPRLLLRNFPGITGKELENNGRNSNGPQLCN